MLDEIDAYVEVRPNSLGLVEAKAKDSTFLSSGIPELTELILALGTSGTITAIASILATYFKNRPNARITIHQRSKNVESIDVSAENVDPGSLSNFLGKTLKR